MHHTQQHPYHLVNPSSLPIITSFSLLVMALGGVAYMHGGFSIKIPHLNIQVSHLLLPLGIILLLGAVWVWWKNVILEGLREGHHTFPVQQGLRIGMALFIISEVMFFFGFFFSYFKSRLAPVSILDGFWPVKAGIWPPPHIHMVDPWHLPLLGTLILLLSGTTVTWAHHALLEENRKDFLQALGISVFLGVSFTIIQLCEYHHAPFKFKDGVFPSNFFMSTGFHGVHVGIGTIFLAICLLRGWKKQFSLDHHLGFEFAAWYWHFVDVVWLFLFAFVYVWGR